MMEQIVDFTMTRLLQLAEYVCRRCSFFVNEPAAKQDVVPKNPVSPIRFSNKDNYVEGELFN
jgi:hypothetical protein